MNRFCRWLFPAALALLLGACHSGPPVILTESITLRIGANLNGDQPVPVDIVYVTDKDLMDRLATVSAHDWFAGKTQFLLDFPNGATVHHWELVPNGRSVSDSVEGPLEKAIAAFLFADYTTPGTHRARLDTLEQPVVRLQALDFHIESGVDEN